MSSKWNKGYNKTHTHKKMKAVLDYCNEHLRIRVTQRPLIPARGHGICRGYVLSTFPRDKMKTYIHGKF